MDGKRELSKVQELVYELKIEQAMTKDVVSVTPHTRMIELRDILRTKRISGVPVADGGKLVGIISIEDFIKSLANDEMGCEIGDRMTLDPEFLYADEPLTQGIQKFEKHDFGRFPVVDRKSGELVGIITKGDIIEGLLRQLEIDYREEEIHRHRASHIFDDIVADTTVLTLQYEIAGQDFDKAGTASSRLKTTLSRMGIDRDIVRRVAIASYEAEMNLVIYTSAGAISTEVTPDQVVLRAMDSGPGIPDVDRALQPGYSTAPEWIRELGFGAGMGLNNIQRCADSMDLKSEVGKGTCLRAVFSLEGKEDDETPRHH